MMKTRLFALAAFAVLILNLAFFAKPDDRKKKATPKRQTSRLVPMLPASDAVAVFDAKRFFDDALPRLLSGNQSVLVEVMNKINEMQARTGVDLRKFQQLAVGVSFV